MRALRFLGRCPRLDLCGPLALRSTTQRDRRNGPLCEVDAAPIGSGPGGVLPKWGLARETTSPIVPTSITSGAAFPSPIFRANGASHPSLGQRWGDAPGWIRAGPWPWHGTQSRISWPPCSPSLTGQSSTAGHRRGGGNPTSASLARAEIPLLQPSIRRPKSPPDCFPDQREHSVNSGSPVARDR